MTYGIVSIIQDLLSKYSLQYVRFYGLLKRYLVAIFLSFLASGFFQDVLITVFCAY